MKPNTNTEAAETVQTTDSPAVVQERLVMPLDLWLQWHGDGDPEDDGEVCESEVTWSREKIFDGDVEYVHAGEIRRALGGHRCSLLWSDTGLIAANMRCVEAVGKLEALYENMDPNGFFARKIAAILGHNANVEARQ